MNSLLLATGPLIWGYHEPFIYTVIHWIFATVEYGFVAVLVVGLVWQVIESSKNKPASREPGTSPASLPKENAQMTGTVTSTEADMSRSTTEELLSPAEASLEVSDADRGLAGTTVGVVDRTAAERLQRLNHLRDQGLISVETYEAKRQQILQTM